MKYGEKGWSKLTNSAPIVETTNGKIRGFCRNGNGVFLGIPYGDNCDGEYRFKAPRPAKDWDGIRDCTTFGPITMQEQMNMDQLPDPIKAVMLEYGNVFTGGIPFDKTKDVCSENCLVLNVVTPNLDDKKRPVMVYIHGGGYVSGSGNVTAAICDQLIDEEDVVIVTINHRLNVFGSLYLGDFDVAYAESGIVTQLDLVLALQWIQNNISQFGGNPEAVTLIGESGGGIKIHHLMAMPEAKGLFVRAIVMSGSIPVGAKTKEEGTTEALKVLETLGIAKEDWRQLLTMPAEQLVNATRGLQLILPMTTPFYPTPDGVRLPANLDKTYKAYEASAKVPLLVGSSEEELASSIPNPAMTWEELKEELLKKEMQLMQVIPGLGDENVDEVIQTFRENCHDTKQPWQILIQIISMAHFLGGGAYLAAMAKAAAKGAPVWHYTTTYDTPVPGYGALACAWHTAELPLAFRAVYRKESEKLSRIIARAFTAFARTGSPSTEEISWTEFTIEKKATMIFDKESSCKEDPYHNVYKALDKILVKN